MLANTNSLKLIHNKLRENDLPGPFPSFYPSSQTGCQWTTRSGSGRAIGAGPQAAVTQTVPAIRAATADALRRFVGLRPRRTAWHPSEPLQINNSRA